MRLRSVRGRRPAPAIMSRCPSSASSRRSFPPIARRSPICMGLRFIATGVPIEEIDKHYKPGDLEFVARTKDAYVYENTRALPRVLLATCAVARRFRADDRRRRVAGARLSRRPFCSRNRRSATTRAPNRARAAERASAPTRNTEIVIDADAPRGGGHVVLNDVCHPVLDRDDRRRAGAGAARQCDVPRRRHAGGPPRAALRLSAVEGLAARNARLTRFRGLTLDLWVKGPIRTLAILGPSLFTACAFDPTPGQVHFLRASVPVFHNAAFSEIDDPRLRQLRGGVEIIHAAELRALVEGGGVEAPRFKAGLADEDRRIGMGRHILLFVGRTDGHEPRGGPFHGRENRICKRDKRHLAAVLKGGRGEDEGSMARVGSVGP